MVTNEEELIEKKIEILKEMNRKINEVLILQQARLLLRNINKLDGVEK